jgi:O-antigen/teichoic acid export membrane protein
MGVSSFILIPIYIKFMEPAEYGVYGIVSTTMTMLGVVMMLGFHSAVGRLFFVYRETGEEKNYLSSLWIFQTVFALGLSLLLGLWGKPLWRWLLPKIPETPYFGLVVAGAICTFSAGIYPIWLRVQEKPRSFVALQIFNTLSLFVFMMILLVGLKGGAQGAVTALLMTNVIMMLLTLFLLGRQIKWVFHLKYIKDSLVFGTWMMLGTLGYFVLTRFQLVILQYYESLAMVGIFNLGLQLGSVLSIIAISFGKAWQPLVYSAVNKMDAAKVIAKTSKYFIAGMSWLTLAICLFSQEIFQVLGRPAYAEAGPILQLVVLAMFMYVFSSFPATALLYERRADLAQVTTLGAALLNLVLSIILVQNWGIRGAAWAMLLSFGVLAVGSHVLAQRMMKIDYPWVDLAKIVGLGCMAVMIQVWIITPLTPFPYSTVLRLMLLLAYLVGLHFWRVFSSFEVRAAWLLIADYWARFCSLVRDYRRALKIGKTDRF